MKLSFPAADVEVHDPAPPTTRLSPLTQYHLDGIRTAITMGLSRQVRPDVALEHAAVQLEKLAMQLAGGACYAVEAPAVEEPKSPGDLVVLDAIDELLDDTAAQGNSDRDHRVAS